MAGSRSSRPGGHHSPNSHIFSLDLDDVFAHLNKSSLAVVLVVVVPARKVPNESRLDFIPLLICHVRISEGRLLGVHDASELAALERGQLELTAVNADQSFSTMEPSLKHVLCHVWRQLVVS